MVKGKVVYISREGKAVQSRPNLNAPVKQNTKGSVGQDLRVAGIEYYDETVAKRDYKG